MRRLTARLAGVSLLAALAVAGSAGVASAATTPGAAPSVSASPEGTRPPVEGTSGLGMLITNHTGATLTLVSDNLPYGTWDSLPPTHIADGEVMSFSMHSSNAEGSQVAVVYRLPDGTQFTLFANSDQIGMNGTNAYAIGGEANHYGIDRSIGVGSHPTASFTLRPA
jgi:hypothetical protein